MDNFNFSVSVSINISDDAKTFIRECIKALSGNNVTISKPNAGGTVPAKAEQFDNVTANVKLANNAMPVKPVGVELKFTVDDVRKALSEKINDHRAEIKAKLTEFGAPNVTKLDPSFYGPMLDFIKSL